MTSRPIQLA